MVDQSLLNAAANELDASGAVLIRGALSATWCERLRHAIEECRQDPGPHYGVLSATGTPRVDSDLFRWSDNATIGELTHRSPLVDVATSLLRTEQVAVVEDQWFASAPGATTPSPWHQDEPYYRLDRPFLTIWVTLDPIPAGGSLRVVPGSHKTNDLFAPVEFASDGTTIAPAADGLVPVPDIDAYPNQFEVTSWELDAGDAIALDSRTLHATGTADVVSTFRRVSTRWAHPDTRYRQRSTSTATFWDSINHGLAEGDRIAGPMFPLVPEG